MSDNNDYGPHLIGCRVITDEGDISTIRYVGELTNTSSGDCWFGVEWDNPKRGKHDGSFKGVNYFKTMFPTSGSFVRPNKVMFGVSVMKAIKLRYSCDDSLIKDLGNPTVLIKRNQGDINIKMVGMEKVSKLFNDLKSIACANLNEQPVSCAEIDKEDADSLVNLKEMILSRTLLSSWIEVAKICEALPQIEILDLSSNKLNPIDKQSKDELSARPNGDQSDQILLQGAFKNIVELNVNHLDYSWDEMLSILNCTSKLTILRAIGNRLNQFPNSYSLTGLRLLTCLDLTSNQISDFNEIFWPLGEQLTHLEYLQLKSNKITNISFPGSIFEKTSLFPSLNTLCVTDNLIDDWSSIDHCNRLYKLTSLVILNNPVLTIDVPNTETAMQVVIAKMEQATKFNHMSITKEERRGAEIDYLKRNAEAWYEAGGGAQAADGKITPASSIFSQKHPRYEKLVALHGATEKSEYVKICGRIREGLLLVNMTYPGKPTIQRSIPNSMSIVQVKRLIRRVLKLSHDDFSLVYTTEKCKTEFALDNETRDLSFFGVGNGDTIHARPKV